MNRIHPILLLLLFFAANAAAQVTDSAGRPQIDSLAPKDTAVVQKDTVTSTHVISADSVSKKPRRDSVWAIDPAIAPSSPAFSWQVLQLHPYFGFVRTGNDTLRFTAEDRRHVEGKELIFYILILLLLIFAVLKNTFPKYFADLFRVFFRTTLKQRQISEQLIQTPLPSLFLNGFFVVTGGLYITFVITHYGINPAGNFWILLLYSCVGLTVAYFLKFVGLKVAGWLFNMQEAADSYIFIVFVVNKMIGILLLPFLVILAFTLGNIYSIGLTLSWCLVGAMLVYRVILTFAAVRNQVRVNPFHFFLYLCAFEIAPLLLVYKALLVFLGITA